MSSLRVSIIVFLLIGTATSASGGISLRGNIFTGYEYALDGHTYVDVDSNGDELRLHMRGSKKAVAQMVKFRTYSNIAEVVGYAGSGLIGVTLGVWTVNDEWQSPYTTLVIVGGSLVTVSLVFIGISAHYLKEAVAVYNSERRKSSLGIALNLRQGCGQTTPILGLRLRF
ncbi:MAG TPA: hypothetical protein PLF13_12775 [candidate division Zixibacteria bacterium]|nr:hypothetical protein [candidate division Zixibacteria bacterium]